MLPDFMIFSTNIHSVRGQRLDAIGPVPRRQDRREGAANEMKADPSPPFPQKPRDWVRDDSWCVRRRRDRVRDDHWREGAGKVQTKMPG